MDETQQQPAAPQGAEPGSTPSRPEGSSAGTGQRPPFGSRPPPGGRGRPERRGGRRFFQRRKVCGFCVGHVTSIDYKDVEQLRRYLSDRAKIEPRRKTGTCARHQRMLAEALKRARIVALLPYTLGHMLDTNSLPTRR